jgi:hypothetical protein
MLISVLCYPLNSVFAEIPHLINYQGRLTDAASAPLSGSYNLTFRIYDAETAGNLLWEETQAGVVINKGIFAVLLGSVTNINLSFDKPYFLEIKVGNEVMSPRQRMASGAYALRAEHGVPKGVIVMWSGAIANIPSGWVLCDGTNGTPDLRDRFIVGARQDESDIAKTNVTGDLTKSGDGQISSHVHEAGMLLAVSSGEHTHSVNLLASLNQYVGKGDGIGIFGKGDLGNYGYLSGISVTIPSNGIHTHAISGSTASSGIGTKNVATYYALAFIMKLE